MQPFLRASHAQSLRGSSACSWMRPSDRPCQWRLSADEVEKTECGWTSNVSFILPTTRRHTSQDHPHPLHCQVSLQPSLLSAMIPLELLCVAEAENFLACLATDELLKRSLLTATDWDSWQELHGDSWQHLQLPGESERHPRRRIGLTEVASGSSLTMDATHLITRSHVRCYFLS